VTPGVAALTGALVYLFEAALTVDTVVALLLLFGYFVVPGIGRQIAIER